MLLLRSKLLGMLSLIHGMSNWLQPDWYHNTAVSNTCQEAIQLSMGDAMASTPRVTALLLVPSAVLSS